MTFPPQDYTFMGPDLGSTHENVSSFSVFSTMRIIELLSSEFPDLTYIESLQLILSALSGSALCQQLVQGPLR